MRAMSVAARACLLALVCVCAVTCGGSASTPTTPTPPSGAAADAIATRIQAGVGLVRVRRNVFAPQQIYDISFALSVTPWPIDPGHVVTIQRAETTLFGPDGAAYHAYVHASLAGMRWTAGSLPFYQPFPPFETLYVDFDATRPTATRYRMVLDYTVTTPAGTSVMAATATGDVVVAGF